MTGVVLGTLVIGILLGYGIRRWEERAAERVEAEVADALLQAMLSAGVDVVDSSARTADGCDPGDHERGVHSPWHLPEQWQGGESR